MTDHHREIIARLTADLAAAREALRFYADPFGREDVTVPDFYDELDFGDTARCALARIDAALAKE